MKSLLLDTHVVLWWLTEAPELAAGIYDVVRDVGNDVAVSGITAFEIATKGNLGKLRVPEDLTDQLARETFRQLPVTLEHGLAAGDLPLHHRDPFDRILIAQARCEGLTLVTADRELAAYDVPILAARS